MALGNRYTFTFESLLDKEEFTVILKQEGYAGTLETLEFLPTRSPIVLSYDKNNANIMHPIRGSQLTLLISLTPAQIQEFILAGNRDWYIELTGSQGFQWYGWLQPQTSVNYNPYGVRQLELQFTDNLGALQTTPDTVLQDSFVALQSLRSMIERQLSYTDINLPVSILTSVRHADEIYNYIQDTVHLEQILCNDINGEQPQMAYSLLSKMARLLQCVVYQRGGEFLVDNWIDKYIGGYPQDLLDSFKIVGRGFNVRFESPLSKVTARSYHYNVRHVIANRDFNVYVPTGPNKGFTDWEQFGTLATEIFSLFQSGNIDFLQILGNYVATNANSTDYYENINAVEIAEGAPMKLYVNYNNTFSGVGTVNPRIALRFEVGVDEYYLNEDNEWELTATPIILTGDAAIDKAKSVTTYAPGTGFATVRIYRPEVPSLGTTYNSGTAYIRYSYVDFGVGKSNIETDLKLFKAVGTKNNKGVRQNEQFETIGLAFDTEFYPTVGNLLFDQYVSLLYDAAGDRLSGDFISDYMPTSIPYGPTEFAANTYMRLFAKPQLYVEAELIGKGLYVGDVYTLSIPGLPDNLSFVVAAYDYDIKNDTYSALLAYIDYDDVNTITMERFWLQQNQDDNE